MATEQTNLLLLCLGSMLMAGGIVLTYMSLRWATLATYCGMWVARLSGAVQFEASTMLFWGIATALCLAIDILLPPNIARSRKGLAHIATGVLAGTAAGMVLNTAAGVICGAVVGAFFGALAFANTAAGRPMDFPSSKFFNYLAAKGLPAIVAFSTIGLVLLQILNANPT